MKKSYLLVLIIICVIFEGCTLPKVNMFNPVTDPLKEYTLEGAGNEKVLLIPVYGMISDSPKKEFIASSPSVVEQVVLQLDKAYKDKQIKAIVFKINSPGGTITASDLLYHEISRYKEKTGCKIVVSMMDLATSGAYYMSLPADLITAHPTTITGSVGVISLQPKVKGLMYKIGVGVDVQKVGKYKDMASPFRETGDDEKALLQKTMNDFGDRFIGLVKKHRNLTPNAIAEISTARIFVADEALQAGLIDKIAYINDAVAEAKKMAGIPENSKVIVYRRNELPETNYYNMADVTSENFKMSFINIDLPEVLSAKAGFYYMWPGAFSNE
ncbi:MAG TPA: signal peptide peptidase SppA [Smithella sp.]|nr:signal peptide peptidase SppA [Smithella sp.]